MKNLLLIAFCALACVQAKPQSAAATWSVRFSDAIISRWPGTINSMTGKGWEYSNTIITHGIEKVYNNVPTPAYLTYIRNYVDAYVNSSGTISASLVSLDRVHPGITCLFLYEKLKSNSADSLRYRTAANTLRNLLVGAGASYSKTSNGILWHKLSGYNNIVMLDGIYMAHPFLVKYGRLFNDNAAIDTAVNQALFVYGQLYDNSTHLIKHAWTSTPAAYPAWANASTGNSSEVWSRAMGWYMMALVDILKYLPPTHPKRASLITALGNLAIGIKNYQDATTGLWYQVVDKGVGHTGYTSANYIESSGSAMFIYALKTAADSGWISSATYLPVAQAGWTGLQNLEITNYSDSKPQINNFAPAMSYQNDYNGYVSILPVDCPSTLNPHGYAAVMMAASVMEFPLITLPVHFSRFTATSLAGANLLHWQNEDDAATSSYNVQRSATASDFQTLSTVPADGSGNYSFTDQQPLASNYNYYRIQALSKDERVVNSTIVAVKNGSPATASLKVIPNSGRNITVIVTGLRPGHYQCRVVNSNGSLLQQQQIHATNTSVTYSLHLQKPTTAGVYIVQLAAPGFQLTCSFMLQ
ncbi:MAG TPA: glycoside hydrolase family 88 protein [Chitinophagaceae bacterium]|nr:glycoside hydrolase family 88 protein [Chitinophagaceae bacterium]